jgi:Ca2+-binding RTX toxin-like protein
MATGPSGFSDKKSIIASQETFLSIYMARNGRMKGNAKTGTAQDKTNSDSVTLSAEALEAARLRDDDRLKEQQTNRKDINTYKPYTGNKSPFNLTGDSGINTLTGGAGNDTLDGLGGADTLIGKGGNDTYIVDNKGDVVTESALSGIDIVNASIDYSLGANVENLTLTGTGNIDGTGNTGKNTITGNTGNNTLDGGLGADTLIGGAGNDTYIINDANDVLKESSGAGSDTVNTSINYSLLDNFENLVLTGAAISGTGNTADNTITGNAGNNTLDGGAGNDTLIGGTGNDTYIVDNSSDVITELSTEGTDIVNASISYTLGANVENLTLTGTGNLSGTGNTGNNTITGNTGNNTLDGGAGADSLTGGIGDDTYLVDNASDVVTESSGEGLDTVNASISYTLGANVENLTLTGSGNINATGSSDDNTINGNVGNNTLDGGAGADLLFGNIGNDTYIIDNVNDVAIEFSGQGTDTVNSSVNYSIGANIENLTLTGTGNLSGTGNTSNNTIKGNSGSNTLDGGGGIDTLIGGTGNDTYVIDDTNDTLTELSGEGTDTVNSSVDYTLKTNFENLTLTGSGDLDGAGNSQDNIITGNSGDNKLSGGGGNDTLIGGGGIDTLEGGAGDDTYAVDDLSDIIVESAGAGTDTVESSISYTIGSNIENLVLTGTGNINGTGSVDNNTITGNSGNNTLTGGGGIDTLKGGTGDDTYVINVSGDATDVVTELSGEGTDTVESFINYSLGANVENLTLA